MKLLNCFDSHLHWQATGESLSRLSLHHLKKPDEVGKLKIESHHFRGEWLTGFGWDQTQWQHPEFPVRQILDRFFPSHPVAFTRVDGHALWLNTRAFQAAGWLDAQAHATSLGLKDIEGGQIFRTADGTPSGVVLDVAMEPFYALIPKPDLALVKTLLLNGSRLLNQAGFTHVRDLTCSAEQWQAARCLEDEGDLTLAVEQYFHASRPSDFEAALQLAEQARCDQQSRLLRPAGIKIYYDGALGSEGAFLSQPYRSCCNGPRGFPLMSRDELKTMIRLTWEKNFDIAVHAIGDEAAHQLVQTAIEVWSSGLKGRLHIEHAEMVRPETIQLMRGRNLICHMQPCHWLTDRRWVDEKLGNLKSYLFPWAELQQNQIEIDFGSDSPIEPASLAATLEAIEDSSRSGIQPVLGHPLSFQQYKDLEWTPDTYTEFVDGQVRKVVFMGQTIVDAISTQPLNSELS